MLKKLATSYLNNMKTISNTTSSSIPRYISIRKFKLTSPTAFHQISEMCKRDFVPLISRHPDFLSYYAMYSPETNEYVSVSIFISKKGATESLELAKAWSTEFLSNLCTFSDHVEGETFVYSDKTL